MHVFQSRLYLDMCKVQQSGLSVMQEKKKRKTAEQLIAFSPRIFIVGFANVVQW